MQKILLVCSAAQTHGISISSPIPGTDANSESLRLLRPTLLSLAGYFNTTTVAQPAVQLLQVSLDDKLAAAAIAVAAATATTCAGIAVAALLLLSLAGYFNTTAVAQPAVQLLHVSVLDRLCCCCC